MRRPSRMAAAMRCSGTTAGQTDSGDERCPFPRPFPVCWLPPIERDAGATWLHTDDGTLSFGGAAAHVVRVCGATRATAAYGTETS